MNRFYSIVLLLLASGIVVAEPVPEPGKNALKVAPTDWPWWRGPTRDGIAPSGQQPPIKWSETGNILWKSPVPGRGHASPTVVGNRIFLATADDAAETQSVLCYDRPSGKLLWEKEVHRGGFSSGGNVKHSHASATVACDGERVFVNFLNQGAIYTTALSLDGKQLWQTRVTPYVLHFGFGSSPALFDNRVIVSADNKGGGVVAGLDRETGRMVWSHPRGKIPNHISPIILRLDDRDQLILTGQLLISSFDPVSGKRLWESKGPVTECCTAALTDGVSIFTGSMHPKVHITAIRADGSGKALWEVPIKMYVPSMVLHRGYLYAVNDNGVAVCLDCRSGKEAWKERLSGNFSASLVLSGDHLFATSEAGQTFVFRATPRAFELIAENQLGNDAFATPSICGDRIYLRVGSRKEGKRQEYLYCVGK